SIFILTRRTAPRAAFTTFSRTGVSWRHGPHQGAQKSTITGTFRDASITSTTKVCVVVSLIKSPALSGFWAAAPPRSEMAICPVTQIYASGEVHWRKALARTLKSLRKNGFEAAIKQAENNFL